MQLDVPTAEDMESLGAQVAGACSSGSVVFLFGDLGAGKTTLVRGFLRALGHAGAVKSPTFTLVEPYELQGRRVFHFDLYRLGDPEELEYLGARDYFTGDSVCLVEWPERGRGYLPDADLKVYIHYAGTGRRVELAASGVRGERILQRLR